MFTKLTITESHLRLLTQLTTGDKYLREAQRGAGVSPRTAQVVLEDLELKGAVTAQTRGKIKIYTAVDKHYLVLAEQYKLLAFMEKHTLIRAVIEKIDEQITGVAIIYGSYAKETNTKKSDLDIIIIGSYDKKINDIAKAYGIELDIKHRKSFGKTPDTILKEVIKDHIVLKGVEEYVRWQLTIGANAKSLS